VSYVERKRGGHTPLIFLNQGKLRQMMLHPIGAILKVLYYENNKSPVYFGDLLYKNWIDK